MGRTKKPLTIAVTIYSVALLAHAANLKTLSSADRAVEDLNWPNRPAYDLYVSEASHAPQIAQLRTALQTSIESQKFSGRGCDQPAFQAPPEGAKVASVVAIDSKEASYRFSLKPIKRTDFNTTTFVRTGPDNQTVVAYTTATCQDTKLFGLLDACVVSAFCKVADKSVD